VSPIKIRIKRPLTTFPLAEAPHNNKHDTMSRRSSAHSRQQADPYSSSGRMRRQTAAAPSYKEEPDSEDDAFDPRPKRAKEADSEEEDFDRKPTRSGRSVKIPARYAAEEVTEHRGMGNGGARRSSRGSRVVDEDAFENTMMTSPIAESPVQSRASRSGGRPKKRIVDPDDSEDDDAEGEIEVERGSPPPKSHPTRATRSTHVDDDDADFDNSQGRGNANGRSTRSSNRAKSRHSSADAESYREASASVTDEDEAIISPERDFDEFDDDESDSEPARPRRTVRAAPARSTRAGPGRPRRSTRTSARTNHDDSDEPKRTLRERPKVNYQLPPLDMSAEINEATIAAAANGSGPSRKRGVGFAGGTRFSRGGLRGMPWAMGGGQAGKTPQSMGDPDTSDSVSRTADTRGPTLISRIWT